MFVPNLLIIAGTGNKSGKTTIACRLIDQFRDPGVIAVKITPHFHETTPGLILLKEKPGYAIYEETNSETTKDTSRMLRAGAKRVFFAKVTDKTIVAAFNEIQNFFQPDTPVICESPSLRLFTEPALFIIMKSFINDNQKNINNLLDLPHVEFDIASLQGSNKLPIAFQDSRWVAL